MKIREYAKAVNFEVVGKIHYLGKHNLSERVYMDDAGNRYLLDVTLGEIRIVPCRIRKET
jgi:hypothetical protein